MKVHPMNIVKTLASAICIILLACLFIALYHGWSIVTYADGAGERKADAAIVLGAAVWRDQPSPVFKERINHAIWLYRKKMVRKIIFTGAPDSNNEAPESVVARKYAETQLVDPGDILVETSSINTMENLRNAAELGRKHRLRTFLIVSDPLHMKRAMLIARDCKIEAHQSPTRTTRYRSWGNKLQFLLREIYFYLSYSLYRMI